MTVLGVDISWWQGNMNWEKCKNSGAKFAFIRAGSVDNATGLCYEDYKFSRNSDIAPEYLPVGYYWYFRPNHSAQKQADFFLNLMSYAKPVLPCVPDVEADPITWGKPISKAEYANRVATFILALQKENFKVMPYTRISYWDYYIEKRDAWSLLPNWLARYITPATGELTSPWSDGQYISRDWKKATFWQWTSHGDGYSFGTDVGSKMVDEDYFMGTKEEFNAFAGLEQELSQQEKWMRDIDHWARSQGYIGIKPFGE